MDGLNNGTWLQIKERKFIRMDEEEFKKLVKSHGIMKEALDVIYQQGSKHRADPIMLTGIAHDALMEVAEITNPMVEITNK